jgi:glycosyltransferase involved in cell wall biosynthesis
MARRRPRLLFVTYAFPPATGAGTVRVWNIAKYLARSGWAVTVLTLAPALRRRVERAQTVESDLGREGIGRLTSDHRWRWLAAENLKISNNGLAWLVGGIGRRVAGRLGIDPTIGWVKPAERACAKLNKGDIDVVLASGAPFSAFSLARRLSDRLGCPYVLDYRDLWSRNHFSPVPGAVRKEAALVEGSAAVTTVSPSYGSVMASQFAAGPKLHIVSNGYDAEELSAVAPERFDHFAIVYAGKLTLPKQPISPVMTALNRLAMTTRPLGNWKFHYYGRDTGHIMAEAERFSVADQVVVHGRVPRAEALSAVRGAGVAVVVTLTVERPGPQDNGVIPSKIFEAVGLRTPTLLVAPAESDANVVAEMTGLARRFPPTDVEGMASFLGDLMDGHSLEPKDPSAYAWENLVGGLDRVLRSAVGG